MASLATLIQRRKQAEHEPACPQSRRSLAAIATRQQELAVGLACPAQLKHAVRAQ